jgi:hypothetical protein
VVIQKQGDGSKHIHIQRFNSLDHYRTFSYAVANAIESILLATNSVEQQHLPVVPHFQCAHIDRYSDLNVYGTIRL